MTVSQGFERLVTMWWAKRCLLRQPAAAASCLPHAPMHWYCPGGEPMVKGVRAVLMVVATKMVGSSPRWAEGWARGPLEWVKGWGPEVAG